MAMNVLVTGAAGFIGSHTVQAFIDRGDAVVGLDNLNDYYDPNRKQRNLDEVQGSQAARNLTFVEGDVRDSTVVGELFDAHDFDSVVHLAGMPGVRASIEDPALYYDVNLNGTLVLLQAAVRRGKGRQPRFVLASTSSVYGATRELPFTEVDPCDRPLAPYPASKRAAEMLAHSFHHIHGLDVFALRFFTVYGPRNRPDMMAFKIADSTYSGREVPLFNGGRMHRDWTYVDDVVSGIVAAADRGSGYEVINLGRGGPILLNDFIGLIEDQLGLRAILKDEPMPKADVPYTYADISKAEQLLDYHPQVSVEEGVRRFIAWYREAILARGPDGSSVGA
jgi:UDP-glucuronate 4-epimerase